MAKESGELTSLLAQVRETFSLDHLETMRLEWLGKKGILTDRLKALGRLAPAERQEQGAFLNHFKDELLQALDARKSQLIEKIQNEGMASERLDVTLSRGESAVGRIHPLTKTFEDVISIFASMGFSVVEGPEIEEDTLNFDALNIPADHPARADHDTFYLPARPDGTKLVLRTHTSPVQIRTMRTQQPPIRIIVPGRVFRADYDATHTPMFHQVEGLYIDKNITMGHLKGCISQFLRVFFARENLPIRLRPSYFPFTEPSAEVDIACHKGKDAFIIGEGSDWLEILGCGMVHPQVLRNAGLDPEIYQGFAFGMGLERITMLKYGIGDLRMFFDGDLRWTTHYGFSALTMGGGIL